MLTFCQLSGKEDTLLPDQDDCAVVTVSTSSISEHCELDKGSTLSSVSPGANDNLDTSPCTVLAPTPSPIS